MSILFLEMPDKLQDLQDDLESFVYVVLYHVLRYMNHNKADNVRVIIQRVFDDYFINANGTIQGGAGKRILESYIRHKFKVLRNPYLNDWLQFALKGVQDWVKAMDAWLSYTQCDGLQIQFEDEDEKEDTDGEVYRWRGRHSWRRHTWRKSHFKQISSFLEVEQHRYDNVDLPSAMKHLRFHSHQPLEAMWWALLKKKKWPQGDGPVDHLSHSSSLKRTHDGNLVETSPPLKKFRTIAAPYAPSAATNTPNSLPSRATHQQTIPGSSP